MNTNREDVLAAYRILLNREPENDSLIDYWMGNSPTTTELKNKLLSSEEYLNNNPAPDLINSILRSKKDIEELGPNMSDIYLPIIHYARLHIIRYLLPAGNNILDLGGAHSPLHQMGYPHKYSNLILIDLPMEERHKFHQVELQGGEGKVFVRYQDMTDLEGIENNSIDLIWSGQSIEHVPADLGIRMCKEAFRVLKKGGHFCLDTPNRLVTQLHTMESGGGFIFPDHEIEYTPPQLRDILSSAGFDIVDEWGICEMPLSVKNNSFTYSDFLLGGLLTKNINDAYMQYFHCQKP